MDSDTQTASGSSRLFVAISLFLFILVGQIHRASATIIEPTGESDNPLKFTTGLVVALDIDATLEHVQDPQTTVKVQVRGFNLRKMTFQPFVDTSAHPVSF